jgi:hypothetical protein
MNSKIVVKQYHWQHTWKLELKPKCLSLMGLKVTRSSMTTSQVFDWEHSEVLGWQESHSLAINMLMCPTYFLQYKPQQSGASSFQLESNKMENKTRIQSHGKTIKTGIQDQQVENKEKKRKQ